MFTLVGGPERWTNVGGAMKRIGIDFMPVFWGFMAAITESLGGLLLALGLFTRPVCLLLGFTMLMATISHYASGRGNPGNAVKFLFVFVGLFIIGPGKYSVDEWLSKKRQK
ncbi:DoxX family protein [candidate division KSB1 bacterium]|nr:DoxX family protein [candidate division KSB1 bacterium]